MFWCSFFHYSFPYERNLKEYDPTEAVEVYPIETVKNWLTGTNWQSNSFRRGTDPPKYFGSTLAGQAEFTWVVDVRNMKDENQENWAPGNLISDLWLLTACSIVKDWSKVLEKGGIQKYGSYAVLFCTNYIYEDYIRFDDKNKELYHLFQGHDRSGTRSIVQVVKHPECNTMTRLHNFLLMKVNHHIPIYPPVLGYMPIFGAPDSIGGTAIALKESVYPHLANMDGKRGFKKLVCYVASFGRPYNNVEKPGNEHYKVKYRAYFSDYELCGQSYDYKLWLAFCTNNGNNPRSPNDKNVVNEECADAVSYSGGLKGPFMCFRTYAKHGAVCDHDHGAPLVCNGEVYGFVARGVPAEYCVNNRMFPFLVTKLDTIQSARLYPQPPGVPDFGHSAD